VQKNEPPSRVPALGPELATTNPQLAPSSAIKDGTNIAATAKLPANYLRLTVRGRVLRFGVRQCGRWHTRLFVSVAVRHDAEVEINAGLTSGQLPHFILLLVSAVRDAKNPQPVPCADGKRTDYSFLLMRTLSGLDCVSNAQSVN
jgi:hypothetical protein